MIEFVVEHCSKLLARSPAAARRNFEHSISPGLLPSAARCYRNSYKVAFHSCVKDGLGNYTGYVARATLCSPCRLLQRQQRSQCLGIDGFRVHLRAVRCMHALEHCPNIDVRSATAGFPVPLGREKLSLFLLPVPQSI